MALPLMEDSEVDQWELLNHISLSAFFCIEIMETTFHLPSLSSDPLFSCIITLCILIILYFPQILFTIAFSPVVILTGILLLTLLRIGARQKLQIGNRDDGDDKSIEAEKPDKSTQVHEWVVCPTNPDLEETFVEWNVRAPLEVIYEAYEGEERDDQKGEDQNDLWYAGIERTSSLSMYYPESDSDSDDSSEGDFSETAEWDSPEKWEVEDREDLIEIALEDHNKRRLGYHVEEENMIEIDISPGRNDMFTEGD